MSCQKALCMICERPTADGAVLAVHVDKEKMQNWFLNVCEYELIEEIQDEDLICYFCAWQAEFLWNFNGISDEALVWWNFELDNAARELRKNYFEGNTEQCWVQLEEVDLPEGREDATRKEMESETQSNICSEKKKCLYCGKQFIFSHSLSKHVKKTHKNAIRCEYYKCATYFHTIVEREKHNEEVHENPRELKIFKCEFCSKEFIGYRKINNHVRNVHREFPVKCAFRGCVSFFKSDIEMRTHFDSLHDDAKMIDCEYCHFKTRNKKALQAHVARKHNTGKKFKCDKCSKMFPTNSDLSQHVQRVHALKRCRFCKLVVSVGYFAQHIRKLSCFRCKNEFLCSGSYQSHLQKCRETLFKCAKCPKRFQWSSKLACHFKRKHGNREWRGLEHKAIGFKCEPCKMCFKSAKLLKLHINRMHNQSNLKLCAHCPQSFVFTTNLINHLAMKHNLLELEFECDACKKQLISKRSLRKHIMSIHFK